MAENCKRCGKKLSFFAKAPGRKDICVNCFDQENLARTAVNDEEEMSEMEYLVHEVHGIRAIELLLTYVAILLTIIVGVMLYMLFRFRLF